MENFLDLSERIAVVTGGARGIGMAITEILAAHGATVIINGRTDSATLDKIADRITAQSRGSCHAISGDISDPQTVDALAKKAFQLGRRLDIFVNNAGILESGLIGMTPVDEMDRMLHVNLRGTLVGIQAAARMMRRNKGGSIINMTSIMGRLGAKGVLAYSSTKAGVIGATMSAAKELAIDNIRVNAIAPGFIDTDMVKDLSEAAYAERTESIGMGRVGTPQDVAGVALFLASDLSAYVTGQVIGVDGAMII